MIEEIESDNQKNDNKKITCDCGQTVARKSLARHRKSATHSIKTCKNGKGNKKLRT